MSLLSGRWFAVARALCVRYWWKSRYWGHVASCRKVAWCAPLRLRTLISRKMTDTTVSEALRRLMVSMVPLGWWCRSQQRNARGPPSWHVWCMMMAWYREGSKSSRWFKIGVPVLVGMLIWRSF